MADNLVISISADTSKLTAALAVAKRDMKDFGAELNKATAARDAQRIDEWARRYDSATNSVRAITRELANLRRATDALTLDKSKGFEGVSTQLERFGERLKGLVEFTGFGGGIYGFFDQLKKGIESVASIGEQASALGISPQFVQTYRQTFARAGVDADIADKAIDRIVKSLGEERIALYQTGQMQLAQVQTLRGGIQSITPGVSVLHGAADAVKGVNQELQQTAVVLRGGHQAITDYSNVWKAFGVDITRFSTDEKGVEATINALVRGFDEMRKRDPQAAAGLMSNFLGKDWPDQIEALRDFAKQTLDVKRALAGGLGLDTKAFMTPEQIAQAKEAKTAMSEFNIALEDVRNTMAVSFGPMLTKALRSDFVKQQFEQMSADVKEMARSIQEAWDWWKNDPSGEQFFSQQLDEIQQAAAGFRSAFAQLSNGVEEQAKAMWTGIVAQASAAYDAVLGVWSKLPDFFASIASGIKNTLSSIGSAISSVAGNAAQHRGYATGGAVPGSGSGDTVPAWLTPGEFVNRRASVGYYGVDFFRALNDQRIPRGYAFGGVVDRLHSPVQSFANGGLVASAGGKLSVELNIAGNTFPMSSDTDVANRLVRFARTQSMRSAGIKPSWVS